MAARIDEAHDFSGDTIRNADWAGVGSGKAFEKRYCKISERKPGQLKGEAWGEALAAYAIDYPNRSDDRSERPFCRDIRAALRGWNSDCDYQRVRFRFDPDTLGQVDGLVTPAKYELG